MVKKRGTVVGWSEGEPPVAKIKGLDNGVLARPGARRLGCFADLVAEGENPNGLMVQTPNGTSRQDCKQKDKERIWGNVDRWKNNEDWEGDMTGN